MTITNTGASNARFYLEKSLQFKTNSMSRISSGRRIVSASDDAAGLSVATKMRAQIEGTRQASQNSSNAISLVKTAETSSAEIANILNRMRELAIQVKNGTYSGADRAKAQAEVEELRRELNKIAMHTNFNGSKLLDGSFDRDMLVGHSGSETINVDIGDFTSSNLGKGSVAELGSENNHPNIAVTNLSVQEGDVVTIDRSVLGMSALSPAVGGTYSLSGTNADQFTIDSSTGNITAITALDYESPTGGTLRNSTTYRFDVNYTVGGTKYIEEVTLELTDGGSGAQTGNNINIDVTEANTVELNQVASRVTSENFQSFVANDTGSAGAYSLSGTDAAHFSINGDGVITAVGGLDYENPLGGANDDQNQYSLKIEYTNSDGDTFSENITINVNNIDDLDFTLPGWTDSAGLRVHLSVDNGTISLSETTNLIVPYGYSSQDWSGSAEITFLALDSVTAANALQSLSYVGSGGTITRTYSQGDVVFNPNTNTFYQLRSDLPMTTYLNALSWTQTTSYHHGGASPYLVTITTEEESQFIVDHLDVGLSSTLVWVNGSDDANEGVWRYTGGPNDGEVFWIGDENGSSQNGYFAGWSSDNPNDYHGQDYARMQLGTSDPAIDGVWDDITAGHSAQILAEYENIDRSKDLDVSGNAVPSPTTASSTVYSEATQSSSVVLASDFTQSLDDLSLTNLGTITSAIGILDQALQQTSELRAYLGAKTNQLEASYSSLIAQTMYVGLAKGRIMDADMATESTRLALADMLSKTSADMLLRAQTAQKKSLLSIIEQT